MIDLRKFLRSLRRGGVVPPPKLNYPIPASELPDRRKAWLHLSDLWLDTEIDKRFLAGALAVLPYSVDELDEICVFEVAPQLYPNLQSVAGEWAGFDQEWLERSILEYLNSEGWRKKSWNRRARTMRIAGGDWNEVRGMILEIRHRMADVSS